MPCASPTRIRRQLSLVLLVVDSRLRVADFTARRRERFGETEKHVQVFRRRKRKRARDDRGSGAREDAKRWNDDGHAGTFLVSVFPYFSLALSLRAQKRRENPRRRTKTTTTTTTTTTRIPRARVGARAWRAQKARFQIKNSR